MKSSNKFWGIIRHDLAAISSAMMSGERGCLNWKGSEELNYLNEGEKNMHYILFY